MVVPHCFDPAEGDASCDMLGAPHGATQWEVIHAGGAANETGAPPALTLHEGHMRVKVPYAGLFGAFVSCERAEICAARFHIFSLPEMPRDAPAALRVHLWYAPTT